MFIKKRAAAALSYGSPLCICNAVQTKILLCPYLRLTAEIKFAVPCGTSLDFKPPA